LYLEMFFCRVLQLQATVKVDDCFNRWNTFSIGNLKTVDTMVESHMYWTNSLSVYRVSSSRGGCLAKGLWQHLPGWEHHVLFSWREV
jgi:hypothetical protein